MFYNIKKGSTLIISTLPQKPNAHENPILKVKCNLRNQNHFVKVFAIKIIIKSMSKVKNP